MKEKKSEMPSKDASRNTHTHKFTRSLTHSVSEIEDLWKNNDAFEWTKWNWWWQKILCYMRLNDESICAVLPVCGRCWNCIHDCCWCHLMNMPFLLNIQMLQCDTTTSPKCKWIVSYFRFSWWNICEFQFRMNLFSFWYAGAFLLTESCGTRQKQAKWCANDLRQIFSFLSSFFFAHFLLIQNEFKADY